MEISDYCGNIRLKTLKLEMFVYQRNLEWWPALNFDGRGYSAKDPNPLDPQDFGFLDPDPDPFASKLNGSEFGMQVFKYGVS